MLLVASCERPRHFPRMNDARHDDEEAKLLGAALKRLREANGMGQDEAADAAGFNSFQAWQRYEKGAPGIFKPATQQKLVTALGASIGDLQLTFETLRRGGRERSGSQFEEQGRAFEVRVDGRGRAGTSAPVIDDLAGAPHYRDMSWLFGHTSRYMVVAGDSMSGYVEAGMTITYDQSQKPRRGDGCVVELVSGERFVKEYDRTDARHVYVRQRFPEGEIKWPLSEVKGVYKIKARFD